MLARTLRREYGLSQGRKVNDSRGGGDDDTRLPQFDFEDISSAEDFERFEAKSALEQVYSSAPPAQRLALEIYHEA